MYKYKQKQASVAKRIGFSTISSMFPAREVRREHTKWKSDAHKPVDNEEQLTMRGLCNGSPRRFKYAFYPTRMFYWS